MEDNKDAWSSNTLTEQQMMSIANNNNSGSSSKPILFNFLLSFWNLRKIDVLFKSRYFRSRIFDLSCEVKPVYRGQKIPRAVGILRRNGLQLRLTLRSPRVLWKHSS